MADLDKLKEHLAAPEEVKQSPKEQAKLRRREMADAARLERERAGKRKDPPTQEDLTWDLVRVAEDPDCNPYHVFRSLSQRRYELFGHWPLECVLERFGTFEHAKEVAKLVESKGTRTKKLARAEQDRREHAARYVKECIWPHVGTDPARELSDTQLILSISDTHATFLDPFTWWCFLRSCVVLQPDVIFLNGDILEGSEISRYPKIPGWTTPLQLEFDFAREMFRQVREVAPDADVWWGAGNHGLDRLASYLTSVAPALANLRSMRFDQLAGVDEFSVKLSQAGTLASPSGTENELPGTVFGSSYLVTHGTSTAKNAAKVELENHGMSGQSGHTHRAQLYYASTETGGARSHMSTPMGCTSRAGRAYMKGRTYNWQQGFGVAYIHPGGRVHQYPVVTSGGVCCVEGLEFEDQGFPEPNPQSLWIEDFEVPA